MGMVLQPMEKAWQIGNYNKHIIYTNQKTEEANKTKNICQYRQTKNIIIINFIDQVQHFFGRIWVDSNLPLVKTERVVEKIEWKMDKTEQEVGEGGGKYQKGWDN